MMEMIRGTIKVELEDIGEGWDGDYNPDDTEDEPLLRFTFLELVDEDFPDGKWKQIEDASYCTQLPATTPEDIQKKALKWLMDNLDRKHVKKCCERLSWLKLSDLK